MVGTFSVTKHDVDSLNRVDRLQKMCKRNGINFSYIVLESLKLYENEVLSKREDLK